MKGPTCFLEKIRINFQKCRLLKILLRVLSAQWLLTNEHKFTFGFIKVRRIQIAHKRG